MGMKRAACTAIVMSLVIGPAMGANALKALDTDNDGTVDVAEAKAAAEGVFDRLDRDKKGELTKKQLQGRISKKDWSAADPDHDGTVSKEEYLESVETTLKRADKDNEGTLDSQELHSRDGQALLRLSR